MSAETQDNVEATEKVNLKLLRVAIGLVLLGLLAEIPVFVKVLPLTFIVFVSVGVPLVLLGIVLYLIQAYRNLPGRAARRAERK